MEHLLGIDVGSMTCKYVFCSSSGDVLFRRYDRHDARQAGKVLEFLTDLEETCGLTPQKDRLFFTGSGAGLIAPLVGGKTFQEVVALAAAVEKYHSSVHFVSEIGGEDMKTLFFKETGRFKTRQVFMQSACSGGTGTFIEKIARKLLIPLETLSRIRYEGMPLHKISSKCGIFAEVDANNLAKAGVPVEEIFASLFEAVVCQNLAILTKGNTPKPEVLLLGGPNLFFIGLQEAWRYHLRSLWKVRKIPLSDVNSETQVIVPPDALYYAALGCVELGKAEPSGIGIYQGTDSLRRWIQEGQNQQKTKEGKRGLWAVPEELAAFRHRYASRPAEVALPENRSYSGACVVGCDFGSTTAKAVCLSPEGKILFSCYSLSAGNPIEDARNLFRNIKEAGFKRILGLGVTGYGKDLIKGIVGADVPIVETVAHATAALHFFPDADCICDVGGTDVKILILKHGTVSDFRLNSQCSSGNGAFLQGVAEHYGVPLAEYAEQAFQAVMVPQFAMGCGVFLQSDIINQQRKGWSAGEIMAGLAAVLPLNCWVYAGGLQNLSSVGRKFILQGGCHRNLAVVKAQVDYIRSRVPGAEVVVHPYPGEAGAIGAALCATGPAKEKTATQFQGFNVIENLTYNVTTSLETVCHWCPVGCQRTFIDVEVSGGEGRPWSKVPLPEEYERVIVNNSCPRGFVEDITELKVVKEEMERVSHAYPNIAEMVCKTAFRPATP
jgi:predicted CoA-substrate-specific enzyme activase